MVLGVIMMSLGLKKVIGDVAGVDGHTLAAPVRGVPLAALYGGVALYLLGHVGFSHQMTGRVSVERIVLIVTLLALIPAVSFLPAWSSLGVLTVVLVVMIGVETHRRREFRRRVRQAGR